MNTQIKHPFKHVTVMGIIALTLCTFAIPTFATITVTRYSLNTVLNTSPDSIQGGNLGGTGSGGLIALMVRYRTIADTTVNPFGNLSLGNGVTVFDSVDPEVIGKPLVYPNPMRQAAGAQLGFMLSKNMDIEVHVYNMFGIKVLGNTFPAGTPGGLFGYNKLTINTATFGGFSLSAGPYFLVIVHEGKILAKGKFAVIP
ncbi:MAG: hypothetical protein O3A01_03325 [bacterium]|nr:hypothetical protein [bacterium]